VQSLQMSGPAFDAELTLKTEEGGRDIDNVTLQHCDTMEGFHEMEGVLVLFGDLSQNFVCM